MLGPGARPHPLRDPARARGRGRPAAGRPVPLVVLVGRDTEAATRAVVADAARYGLDPGLVRFVRRASCPRSTLAGRALLAARGPPRAGARRPRRAGGRARAQRDARLARGAGRRVAHDVPGGQRARTAPRPGVPRVGGRAPRGRGGQGRAQADAGREGRRLRARARRPRADRRVQRDARRGRRVALSSGSIAVHAFHRAWLAARSRRRRASRSPGIAPAKKVAGLGADGRADDAVEPRTPSSSSSSSSTSFPSRPRVAILEVDRAREFAPVKNATGEDSPETARAAVDAEIRRWHREAGLEVPAGPLDLRPLVADEPDDLRAARTV